MIEVEYSGLVTLGDIPASFYLLYASHSNLGPAFCYERTGQAIVGL